MHPRHLPSYFVGGAALINAEPHLVSDVMGHKFPSPFARPPGKGLSSALVNTLWGFGNLVVAFGLIFRVGSVADHFGPRWALGNGAASGFAAAGGAAGALLRQVKRPFKTV